MRLAAQVRHLDGGMDRRSPTYCHLTFITVPGSALSLRCKLQVFRWSPGNLCTKPWFAVSSGRVRSHRKTASGTVAVQIVWSSRRRVAEYRSHRLCA
jgi:hypothetical protein